MSDGRPESGTEPLEPMERALDVLLQDPNRRLPDHLLQKMFTVAVMQYSRRYEDNPGLPPMLERYINATDVTNSCLEMLRVVDLEVFELTFWGGRISADRD